MTSSRNDKDVKAAIPAPRDHSNDPAMGDNNPAKTSHASTASYTSASAHSQLPIQPDDSFQKTALKEQLLQTEKDTGVEHSTPTTHPSSDKRQRGKPHQFTVAEQGIHYPAITYPRAQGQQANSSQAQLNMDHSTREHLLDDLKRTEFDLREREEQLNDLQYLYRTTLATKDQQVHSLQKQVQTILTTKDQELNDLTDRFRADIDQKNQEVAEIRQMWKQTAKELGKYQAQAKVVDQVTDPEVTQKARQIQYNVRNFAYQHFGGELTTGKNVQGSWQYLQKQLRTPTDFFEAGKNSPMKRPMLIGAFLWDFLVNDVFERFMWCGTGVHHHVENLTDVLSEQSLVASSLNDSNDLDQSPTKAIAWPTVPRKNASIRCGKPTLAPSW